MIVREGTQEESGLIAMLIRDSNRDLAKRFMLNAENCPKHPSFCTLEWVAADFERGERYFICEKAHAPIGCVAIENPAEGIAYMNRLAVLPDERRSGAGETLVRYVIEHSRLCGIKTISIGIVAAHEELRNWYIRLGFTEKDTKRFPHLPFEVMYMCYEI